MKGILKKIVKRDNPGHEKELQDLIEKILAESDELVKKLNGVKEILAAQEPEEFLGKIKS